MLYHIRRCYGRFYLLGVVSDCIASGRLCEKLGPDLVCFALARSSVFSHYAVTHVRNENCIYSREIDSSNVVIGSKLFPLREVPISKCDAIEKNHCLFQ